MNDDLLTLEVKPLVLHLGSLSQKMTDREFFELCQLNRDLNLERCSEGDLIIMPPTGGETGRLNFVLNGLFYAWVETSGLGVGFDSSTGFSLPNGAKRSPDLSWVELSRWESLSEEEKAEFPPLCPDFVVEIRSHSDDMERLKDKMQEYIDNGAQLGWLIDLVEKQVLVYKPEQDIETKNGLVTLSGGSILPGFELDLRKLW